MVQSSRTTTKSKFSSGKISYSLRRCMPRLLERIRYFIKCHGLSFFPLFVHAISTCYICLGIMGRLKDILDIDSGMMEVLVYLQN